MKNKTIPIIAVLIAAIVIGYKLIKHEAPKEQVAPPTKEETKTEEKKDEKKEAPSTESAKKQEPTKTEDDDKSRICAKWSDGQFVKEKEIKDFWNSMQAHKKTVYEQEYMKILFALIDQKNIKKEAQAFEKDPKFLKNLADALEMLLQKMFIEDKTIELSNKNPKEKEDRIKKEYEVLVAPEKGKQEYLIRHILVKTKEEATAILKTIKSGKSFESCISSSLDERTKANKGEIGWVRKSDLPESASAIFRTSPNSIVPEVISIIPNGFSIVYVVNKRDVELPKLDDKNIQQLLWERIKIQYIDTVLNQIRTDANVMKFNLDGSKLEEKKTVDVDLNNVADTVVIAQFGNGDKLLYKDLIELKATFPQDEGGDIIKQHYAELVGLLVDKKVVLDAAKKAEADKKPNYVEKIKPIQDNLLQTTYLENKIEELEKTVKQEEIQKEYDIFASMLKDDFEVRLRYILIKSRADVDAIYAAVKKGEKFEDLAKKMSLDTSTKEKGGDIGGYVRLKEFPEPIARQIRSTTSGAVIKEPIPLGQHGFMVIKVEDKKQVTVPELGKIKPKLLKAIAQRMLRKSIVELRKNHKIQVFDINGIPLKESVILDINLSENAESKSPSTPTA